MVIDGINPQGHLWALPDQPATIADLAVMVEAVVAVVAAHAGPEAAAAVREDGLRTLAQIRNRKRGRHRRARRV